MPFPVYPQRDPEDWHGSIEGCDARDELADAIPASLRTVLIANDELSRRRTMMMETMCAENFGHTTAEGLLRIIANLREAASVQRLTWA